MKLLLLLISAALANPVIMPGSYESGAESSLTVKARPDGDWDIDGASANEQGQVCDVKGKLPKAGGRMQFTDSSEKCALDITPAAQGLEVRYRNEACSAICPGVLSFEGTFSVAKPECASATVAHRRGEGRKEFDLKHYPQASRIFSELDRSCGEVLNTTDRGWLVNDLALSLQKQGDHAGCRKALEPMRALVDTYDANHGLEGLGYDVSLRKSYEKLVKASKTNLKLCSGK